MDAKKALYEKLGASVVEALEKRHFSARYCATGQEAKDAVLSLIAPGKSVGWGGSVTVDDLGIKEALRQRKQPILDRQEAKSPWEADELMKKALTADVFLMSANAISMDGCLVNLDGRGNRVAALIYGADKVIVVAGMNKVVPTVEDAITRTRNVAAPMNAQRFGKTVCCTTGRCMDCKSQDSICANLVITRLNRVPGRIHVILVGEDLGM